MTDRYGRYSKHGCDDEEDHYPENTEQDGGNCRHHRPAAALLLCPVFRRHIRVSGRIRQCEPDTPVCGLPRDDQFR